MVFFISEGKSPIFYCLKRHFNQCLQLYFVKRQASARKLFKSRCNVVNVLSMPRAPPKAQFSVALFYCINNKSGEHLKLQFSLNLFILLLFLPLLLFLLFLLLPLLLLLLPLLLLFLILLLLPFLLLLLPFLSPSSSPSSPSYYSPSSPSLFFLIIKTKSIIKKLVLQ